MCVQSNLMDSGFFAYGANSIAGMQSV